MINVWRCCLLMDIFHHHYPHLPWSLNWITDFEGIGDYQGQPGSQKTTSNSFVSRSQERSSSVIMCWNRSPISHTGLTDDHFHPLPAFSQHCMTLLADSKCQNVNIGTLVSGHGKQQHLFQLQLNHCKRLENFVAHDAIIKGVRN